jgi:hypothetical protein
VDAALCADGRARHFRGARFLALPPIKVILDALILQRKLCFAQKSSFDVDARLSADTGRLPRLRSTLSSSLS